MGLLLTKSGKLELHGSFDAYLAEKKARIEYCNASVGKVYPKDERFAEVKRNAEIREQLKQMGTSFEKVSEVLTAALSSGRKRNTFDFSDRAESLCIADDIMNAPGDACPKGEACVPFEYGRHTACRECNQVRDFGLNAGV